MFNDIDNERVIRVESLDELPAAASLILEYFDKQKVILFEGEMGAGKTTLIKEICKALGIEDQISSPTFSLVNEYEDREGLPVYHFDFYRINNEEEALSIGCTEYFDSGDLCLIEWPSLVKNLLPEHYLLINIEELNNKEREIKIKSF